MGRVANEHLYFGPELNGDLLIGGGNRTVEEPVAVSTDADEAFRREVADFVPRIVSGAETFGVVSGWAGVDVASPDSRPIIDAPAGAPDGVIVATGFTGLGIVTSPVVGPVVRECLTGADPEIPTEPFAANRFEDVSDEFEYVSTTDL